MRYIGCGSLIGMRPPYSDWASYSFAGVRTNHGMIFERTLT